MRGQVEDELKNVYIEASKSMQAYSPARCPLLHDAPLSAAVDRITQPPPSSMQDDWPSNSASGASLASLALRRSRWHGVTKKRM